MTKISKKSKSCKKKRQKMTNKQQKTPKMAKNYLCRFQISADSRIFDFQFRKCDFFSFQTGKKTKKIEKLAKVF
jgi:hypothetical protein